MNEFRRDDSSSDSLPENSRLNSFSFDQRPRVHGKFIFVGDEKFYLRGVTYGTFKNQFECGYFANCRCWNNDSNWRA